jgi:hypothetical protein
MSEFNRATEKISIGSLDEGSISVTAQYNPKEVQVDMTVPWQQVSQSNKANHAGIHLEFTGAAGREITVELLFDGYETNESIEKHVRALETLASVWKPHSKKENERRPHRCVAKWGKTVESFRCVIESLSTKYTMFSDTGVPLRATCTVKLKEADVLSLAKEAPGTVINGSSSSGSGTSGSGTSGSGTSGSGA